MMRWFRKQRILFGYARLDRQCAKLGHQDFGCYSVDGSLGDKCGRCGRILWTYSPDDQPEDLPIYQAPSRQTYF